MSNEQADGVPLVDRFRAALRSQLLGSMTIEQADTFIANLEAMSDKQPSAPPTPYWCDKIWDVLRCRVCRAEAWSIAEMKHKKGCHIGAEAMSDKQPSAPPTQVNPRERILVNSAFRKGWGAAMSDRPFAEEIMKARQELLGDNLAPVEPAEHRADTQSAPIPEAKPISAYLEVQQLEHRTWPKPIPAKEQPPTSARELDSTLSSEQQNELLHLLFQYANETDKTVILHFVKSCIRSYALSREQAARLADAPAQRALERPRIVCLCGSTRFYEAFMEANYRETMAGRIVLSVGFFMHRPDTANSEDVGCTPEQKVALDELHKRKIDLADEVFVLNVGGYIGSSTRSEIEYAEAHKKPIRYLELEQAIRSLKGNGK